MTKYAFFSFPAYGHVNPVLAIVQELVMRGEEVIYYLTPNFRQIVEATGATFRAYEFDPFSGQTPTNNPSSGQTPTNNPSSAHKSPGDVSSGDKRIAMLPMLMIQRSSEAIPPLLESVRSEQVDCIVYEPMFLWAKLIAQILHIPAVALHPSYAANGQSNVFAQRAERFPNFPDTKIALNEQLAQLCSTYGLPQLDMSSLMMSKEALRIVFLPRAFQPGGETFDESFLFVGPSLQSQRQGNEDFPFEQLDEKRPLLYISFGTVFNDQVDFYNQSFAAFGASDWQVVLSLGSRIDRDALHAIPPNFIAVPHVPQLEILERADLFISHGGMNSTMESLYYGVPLVVIPQIMEEEITAQRVQALGLGIYLDRNAVTVESLREAVENIAHDPAYRVRVRAMQQEEREAGGYLRAADALMQFAHSITHR